MAAGAWLEVRLGCSGSGDNSENIDFVIDIAIVLEIAIVIEIAIAIAMLSLTLTKCWLRCFRSR